MDKLHNIFYTAGCHGNFLKYLFDCYNQRKLLPNPFDENGNSHLRQNHLDINRNFDVCHDKEHQRLTDNIALIDTESIPPDQQRLIDDIASIDTESIPPDQQPLTDDKALIDIEGIPPDQ